MRRRGAFLAVTVLLTACSSGTADDTVTPAESPEPGPTSSPRDLRRVAGVDIAEPEADTTLEPDELPYAYTPAPPLEPTPVDGTYIRILKFEDIGLPPPQNFPIRCLRCAPFYVHAGVTSLILDQGRYWLHHQLSGFESLGHFRVHGNRITLLNDPHCQEDPGRYRWNLEDDYHMTFELLGGDCIWEPARAKDLTIETWTRVDPCVFRFENLWPARLGC